jgi:hypothetical protein
MDPNAPRRSPVPHRPIQGTNQAVTTEAPREDNLTPQGNFGSFGTPNTFSKVLVVCLIVLSLAVVAALGAKAFHQYGVGAPASEQSAVKSAQYQAVFLANGQVYFGKIKSINDSYVTVNDIYYLQQQVQQQQQAKDAKDQNSNLSLTKLGNELHGPEDSMYISKDQVTFWENLKDDSKVAQAIKDYKTKQ